MITTRSKLTRYGTSLAVVLGVHAVAIALMLHMSVPRQPQLPPAAMVIDLAPMPAPPPPAPPKVITPPQPPAPVEELPLPKLAEAPKPTIQVPKPVKPKPKPQPPKPVEKKPEPPKEKPSEDPPSETPPTHAPAEKSAQPAPGPSPQQVAAKASWEGALLAHLQKYKKYPPGAQARGKEGLNRLRFVVDAEGNVLSYELVGRSGNADLDRATLDMIRRAQPLPKPPADMVKSGSIEIVAPFVYNIEKNRR
ncbi:TonB family protein [Pseudomonas sp. MPB23]|jgi:protein TonB|uniref:TonB family protein n=1 Tax=Pseudomonas sp. MPB23 TaxID=3388490 RepID=UPI003984E994